VRYVCLSVGKQKAQPINGRSYAGLPDFSWYKIPKTAKEYTKLPQNITNGNDIYQMAVK
jgi:hypothetical protein